MLHTYRDISYLWQLKSHGMPYLAAQTITIQMIFPCVVSREAVEEEVRYAAAYCRLHMPHVSVLREPERNAGVAHE